MSNLDFENDEMLPEYDFSKGVRNPYAGLAKEQQSVCLDDDVRAVFPDSESVNTALRTLIKTARAVVPTDLKRAS